MVLAALQRPCDRQHDHEQLVGNDRVGPRSRQAQEYPSGLVEAVPKAYAKSCNLDRKSLHTVYDTHVIDQDRKRDQGYFEQNELEEIMASSDPPPPMALRSTSSLDWQSLCCQTLKKLLGIFGLGLTRPRQSSKQPKEMDPPSCWWNFE